MIDVRYWPKADIALWAELFRKMVRNAPSDHFKPYDDEMLLSFCTMTLKVRALQDVNTHEGMKMLATALRSQASLAKALRVTPSARVNPRATGRMQAPVSEYDRMAEEDDDDDRTS
jgi:hypothetical protein